VVGCPDTPGPSEAALDLVEDEDDAVAVAQVAETGQEAVRRDDAVADRDDDRATA
jgi:hypothetical protein